MSITVSQEEYKKGILSRKKLAEFAIKYLDPKISEENRELILTFLIQPSENFPVKIDDNEYLNYSTIFLAGYSFAKKHK